MLGSEHSGLRVRLTPRAFPVGRQAYLIEKANLAVDIMQGAAVISVTPRIAIRAAKLVKEHKLPLADSIIYAIAKIYGVEISTALQRDARRKIRGTGLQRPVVYSAARGAGRFYE